MDKDEFLFFYDLIHFQKPSYFNDFPYDDFVRFDLG